jgi:glutaredoxin
MLKWPFKKTSAASGTTPVILYTRQRCHLCDEAKAVLCRLQREERFEFSEIDIDTDADLQALYNEEVPVVFIHGRKAFKYAVDEKKFLKSLRAGPAQS